MLYAFKLLFFLININQDTILNWFNINDILTENSVINGSQNNIRYSSEISLKTFFLIIEGLGEKIQAGLTLTDIENLLIFIVLSRFLILSIKYNLKTAFYITCIGLFAGYLWYKHLISTIAMYRAILVNIPYFDKLGTDAIQLDLLSRQMALTDVKLGSNVHWYNPGRLIYYGFINGIKNTNLETGLKYYIDPISMFISNLEEPERTTILPIYYKVYNKIIPQIFEIVTKFWTQISGIAAYSIITRIGKRYCPYLVRWHWTFLLVIGFIEQIIIFFCSRIYFFQSNILIPQIQQVTDSSLERLALQVNLLNGFLGFIVCFHLGLIFFGLFHAIWGQYFYIPFLVENAELHIGPRPKNTIYSGGSTSWQDEKKTNIQRKFPKLWYGWFGRGTKKKSNVFILLQNFIRSISKRLQN